MSDDEHTHIEVNLAVSCCDPAEVSVVAEKLARVMAGFALDGHETRLYVWRFAADQEDEDVETS
jgi:hypothetical protein